jgi:hypothetical protein
MAAQERVGNSGYIAFGTEATKGTGVTPTVFAFLDNETMTSSYNLEDQTPIAGIPIETFQILPGMRDHKGEIEIVAEPNTALEICDMLLTRGSVSGGGPYTWPFTISATTNPKSKTIDISTGNVVKRFVGCEASKLVPAFSKNQLNLKASISALGSFQGGVLASTPTGTGPYTVVFDTTYDQVPTRCLVVGDLIRFYKASTGVTIDATVASITNGTTITTATNVTTMAAGDIMHLRPATASYTVVAPFLWTNTFFGFGATAAAALTAATFANQTRVEQSSAWEIDYPFESDNGSQRSGSADPASLIRFPAKAGLTIKKFFDTPDDVINFNEQNKTACVIRHISVVGANTYELRVTLNHIKTDDPLPKIKSKAVNYSSIKFHPQWDTTDSQLAALTLITSINTIG